MKNTRLNYPRSIRNSRNREQLIQISNPISHDEFEATERAEKKSNSLLAPTLDEKNT